MSQPSSRLPFDLPPRPSSSSSTRSSPIVSISTVTAPAKTIKIRSQTNPNTTFDMDSLNASPPSPSHSFDDPDQPTEATGTSALSRIQSIAREQRSKLVDINLAQKTSTMTNIAKSKGSEFKDRAYEKGTEWTKFGRNTLGKWKARNSQEHSASSLIDTGRIFGQPLQTAVDLSSIDKKCPVPAVVIRCIEYLDCNGLTEVGLYRVPGSTSAVTQLKAAFDGGDDMDLLNHHEDPSTVATLLKMYLRELPDPIIPKDLLSEFNGCLPKNGELSPEQRQRQMESVPERLASVAMRLPDANYYLLHWLMSHLARLDFYHTQNKMTISNLGLIFCPTLLIGSLLFTALVNHVGIIFPLPRKSNPKESEIAPSNSVSVSKRTLRHSLLRTPAANRIPPPRPPRSPSTLSKLNAKPMKANEIRPNPSTVSRPSEVPTGDLIDFDSPIMTESPESSENRHNITSDQEDGTESDTSEDSSSSSGTASSDHNRKDDSGLVSIDIDGNGLNTGMLNLNIRRSAATRNSTHITTPAQHPSVLDESLDNAEATPDTPGLALQSPMLPSKPQRLTRKLTPRTSTKYVKDMLDLVDH